MASRLEREWGKTAGVVEYAIAVLKGKNAAGFWQAQILESTDQDALGSVWAVSESDVHNIWHKGVPFLGKYTPEGEFLTPIPLTKVRA